MLLIGRSSGWTPPCVASSQNRPRQRRPRPLRATCPCSLDRRCPHLRCPRQQGPARNRASCCGRVPSACRGPCRGPCCRWAPHQQPPRHSIASTSMPASSSASTSLHFLSKQQVDVVLENICCKCLFQVFWIFQRYIASVSYGCCKNKSRCCICCNGCTRML
jgi:hypothetical protein